MPDAQHAHGRGRGPVRPLDARWGMRVEANGGYFRALPGLEPLRVADAELRDLADGMKDVVPDPEGGGWKKKEPQGHDAGDNVALPAGYTYIGQALDHDITFDAEADDSALNRLNTKTNFRTPTLDLDSLYGLGPHVQPYLYADDGKHLRVGADGDLPRVEGNAAVIGDPRNDENAIVARVQVGLRDFHNAVLNAIGPDREDALAQARKITRWCYQYATVHDYLRRIVGEEQLASVLRGPRVILSWPRSRALPIEFVGAAYRFGHSQVRPNYQLTEGESLRPIFGEQGNDLRGGQPLAATAPFDWDHLLGFNAQDEATQPTRLIDTKIAEALFRLFGADALESPPHDNLAHRNLRKGVLLGLPSGETVGHEVAGRLDEAAKSPAGRARADSLVSEATEIRSHLEATTSVFDHGTPLWFWLLREAAQTRAGTTLGRVGGRLVAETFVSILENDATSYWGNRPFFAPTTSDGRALDWPAMLTGELPDGVSELTD